MKRSVLTSILALVLIGLTSVVEGAAPEAKLTGARRVEVVYDGNAYAFDVAPAPWKVVVDESYSSLPVYNPSASSWTRGRVLSGMRACECAAFGALDPSSVVVKSESTGETLTRGQDFEFDESSGALGRLDGGKLGSSDVALVSYRCVESRIDSIVVDAEGKVELVEGKSKVLSPEPPVLSEGQKRLVNVYSTGLGADLTDASIFPIDEVFANEPNSLDAGAFVANVDKYYAANGGREIPSVSNVGAAKKYLPKTWKKLTEGEEVRILAWGDSVTACGFIPDDQRWQVQFVDRLQAMFPKAKITLMTEAWGGRSSDSYRNEPAGSPKNYREKVLAVKPDLIVSEFVNDAYMDEATVAKKYGEMHADFQANDMEWIILGPHFVRPDWMGLASEKNCDVDPRPMVKGLRAFTIANDVPFADAPDLYGKLWRAGVPYNTLMTNSINHPNGFGMALFAASLARLFEE